MKRLDTSPDLARRAFCLSALATAGSGLLLANELLGQQPPPSARPPSATPTPRPPAPAPRKPAPRKPAPSKKDEASAPRPVTLETRDGVALKAVYFPGGRGKETVPIILLHGWEQRGVVWEQLATYLQKNFGHAVLVPDLRGHGHSVTQTGGVQARQLEPDNLTPADMNAMVWDVQACKKFLEGENNKGELNINMLSLVGAEYGALVAMQFTAMDWSWPVLTTGKQGQDVKALVMLTPIDRFKRVTAATAIQALRTPIVTRNLSILIVAGQQDRGGYSDAKRLHRQLEGMFPNDEKATALQLVTPDTNSHGTQLIEPQRRLGIERALTEFLNQRIVARKSEFEWSERKSPLNR